MQAFLCRVLSLQEHQTASHLAFGDLFLEDIRRYREDNLRGTGFTPLFPVWGTDTTGLAETMIASGMRAIITAGDSRLPGAMVGRWFDQQFLADLPAGVDPLGENGEFHTCVVDGPMFTSPIQVRPEQVVHGRILTSGVRT
jgi:diphthamide synthase (EF-2-diphthine--ammonia ligase)